MTFKCIVVARYRQDWTQKLFYFSTKICNIWGTGSQMVYSDILVCEGVSFNLGIDILGILIFCLYIYSRLWGCFVQPRQCLYSWFEGWAESLGRPSSSIVSGTLVIQKSGLSLSQQVNRLDKYFEATRTIVSIHFTPYTWKHKIIINHHDRQKN